jgi:exodeoxyribonuclease VIII
MDFAIDIETLGRVAGCPVLSIGCVGFERNSEGIDTEFYIELKLDKQLQDGLTPEAETLSFWIQQEDVSVLTNHDNAKVDVITSLGMLNDHIGQWGDDSSCVWATGTDFDIGILKWMYHEYGMPWPFHYSAARDVRTLCDVKGFDRKTFVLPGLIAHNALDDAIYAASCVQAAIKYGKL